MTNLKHTHLIWDFNGTVLDDVRLGIRCVNIMLEKRGLPTLDSVEAYQKAFGFPIDAYYRRLGFDFEKEDYETVLAPEWVAHYLAGEPHCGMNPGVRETMEAVTAMEVPQIMLSASKLEQLESQLDRLGIRNVFDEVLGLDNIHARSKAFLALAWKERNPRACPLFVGDTGHDAEVAAAIGADCVLYTGGHQSEAQLSGLGYPLIHDLRELISLL